MLTDRERSAYVDPFARDWPGLATTDTGISCFCFKKFTLLNYLYTVRLYSTPADIRNASHYRISQLRLSVYHTALFDVFKDLYLKLQVPAAARAGFFRLRGSVQSLLLRRHVSVLLRSALLSSPLYICRLRA